MAELNNAGDSSGHDEKVAPSLTERMRTRSRMEHEKSDRLVNLKLALVLTSPRLYGEALALFAAVFARLERISQNQAHLLGPAINMLDKTRKGFEDDLAHYLGPNWRTATLVPAELTDYLDRLDELEREDPTRLLAYVYHMQMAILSGGYIIQKIVRRAMGLDKDSDDGVRTFAFKDRNQAKHDLKRFVDEELCAKLTEMQIEGILEESINVFRMNNRLVSTVDNMPVFQTAGIFFFKRVLIPIAVVSVVVAASMFYNGKNTGTSTEKK